MKSVHRLGSPTEQWTRFNRYDNCTRYLPLTMLKYKDLFS